MVNSLGLDVHGSKPSEDTPPSPEETKEEDPFHFNDWLTAPNPSTEPGDSWGVPAKGDSWVEASDNTSWEATPANNDWGFGSSEGNNDWGAGSSRANDEWGGTGGSSGLEPDDDNQSRNYRGRGGKSRGGRGRGNDSERGGRKPKGYVPDEPPLRLKMTAEEETELMEKMKLQNEKIKERREYVKADEEAFNSSVTAELARQAANRKVQAQINQSRELNAKRKLEKMANREWDSGKDPSGEWGGRGRGRGRGKVMSRGTGKNKSVSDVPTDESRETKPQPGSHNVSSEGAQDTVEDSICSPTKPEVDKQGT